MLNNLDLKKIYYYTICIITFFVLMWGVIDLTSAGIGLLTTKGTAVVGQSGLEKESETLVDTYYQRKMLFDRLFDSASRIIISGAIFTYCRIQVKKLES